MSKDQLLYKGELVEIFVPASFNEKATTRYRGKVVASNGAGVRIEIDAVGQSDGWREYEETMVFTWHQIRKVFIVREEDEPAD